MAEPLNRPLRARRNTAFAQAFPFTDAETDLPVDFTGAAVAMQVRLYGAQAGDALITLSEVATPTTEGLLVEDGLITVFIDETSLSLLPRGKAGADIVFQYDLKVQLAGALAEVWAEGAFTVTPGVTDRLRILTNDAGAMLTSDAGLILIAGH